MRKFILITAMVLASATAQAGANRGLTLASNEVPAAAEASKAVNATAEQGQPATETTQIAKVEKPKRKRESTEARVIRELHRHGVYW